MKRKPVVGETLLLRRCHRNSEPQISEVVVSKVGRRYFDVKSNDKWSFTQKFRLGTWDSAEHFIRNNQGDALYENQEEIDQMVEHLTLAKSLSDSLRYRVDFEKLELHQLRLIDQIVNDGNPTP